MAQEKQSICQNVCMYVVLELRHTSDLLIAENSVCLLEHSMH